MSFRVVRQSKFRHVFGKQLKRDQGYDGVRITRSSWDSTFCAVNPKYLAIITEAAGGGAFLVLPLEKTGRIERDSPQVTGHKAAVLDIQWCPHHDDVIASGSEDCTVKIWQIPSYGLTRNLDEPIVDLVAHQRRVGLVLWHPTAQNVLLSAGSDHKVFIWNAGAAEVMVEIDFPDMPLSACWNYDGSRFVTTCKDKMIRVYDPRSGQVVKEGKGHEGAKPSQCVFLKNGDIFTTGFSKMSERQYGLWNKNLENMCLQEIDTSNGVIFPFYDADTSVVYLCGKGDSVIRYFEVTDEAPYVHFLNAFQSNEPQRGIGMMPKRGVDVNQCEITRFYRLLTKGLCEVIPMTVPRKSELFQDDLYPDTPGDVPAVTAEEWFEGRDAQPVLVSMKEGYKSSKKDPIKASKKANILAKPIAQSQRDTTAAPVAPKPAPVNSASNRNNVASEPAPQPAATLPPNFDLDGLLADMKYIKETIRSQEKRIKQLEDHVEAREREEEMKKMTASEDGADSGEQSSDKDDEKDGDDEKNEKQDDEKEIEDEKEKEEEKEEVINDQE